MPSFNLYLSLIFNNSASDFESTPFITSSCINLNLGSAVTAAVVAALNAFITLVESSKSASSMSTISSGDGINLSI